MIVAHQRRVSAPRLRQASVLARIDRNRDAAQDPETLGHDSYLHARLTARAASPSIHGVSR